MSHMNTLKRAILALAVLVTGVAVLGGTATATNTHPEHKVFVCKYVGTPHVDERLQTGQNPIEVDGHALTGKDEDPQVGDLFSDAHGFSVVVQVGGEDPGVGACQAPTYEPVVVVTEGICAVGDTTITVTTTTHTYHAEGYATAYVKVEDVGSPVVVVSTRPLNEAEAVACAPVETTVPVTTVPGDTTTTVAVIVGTPPVPPAPAAPAAPVAPTPTIATGLPHTGNSSGGILMFAAILSLMGAGATALARRKSTII